MSALARDDHGDDESGRGEFTAAGSVTDDRAGSASLLPRLPVCRAAAVNRTGHRTPRRESNARADRRGP